MTERTANERILLEMIADRPILRSPYTAWLDQALLEQLLKRRLATTVHSPHGTIYRITRRGLKALAE